MSGKYKYCQESPFMEHLEEAGRRHGRSTVFSDFLTIVVCCLSAQEQEGTYLKIIKKYSKDELNSIASAFAYLIDEMDDKGEGLKDCLGDYYMEVLGSKRNGQFFTPPHVCELMAQLNPPPKFEPMNDPCCGSGRFFLASAKAERLIYCYGEDIDYHCCQMTLINLCLNGLYGVVTHQDTLSLETWHRWEIKLHPKYKFPYIHEINLNEVTEEPETEQPTAEIRKAETVVKPLTEFDLLIQKIDSLL